MKFSVIVADCPYGFSDKLTMSSVKRGADSNYNGVLSIADIKALDVPSITADDALLALWVPSSLLQDGLDIMKAYGFRMTQNHPWIKTKKDPLGDLRKTVLKAASKNDLQAINKSFDEFDFNDLLSFGMGRLFRNVHEICLLGVKGKVYDKLKNKSQRSVHFAPNLEHSAKPPILQDRLDLMFPGFDKKIEMFARRSRDGWVCVGNQLNSTNPNDSPFGEDIRDAINRLKKL